MQEDSFFDHANSSEGKITLVEWAKTCVLIPYLFVIIAGTLILSFKLNGLPKIQDI